ncbi:MAG: MBL fold metallo-hydrolase [Firmicutes bacterium]|nr:MBL fold metallo-hydrolase [Bacillota bacterium]
MQKQKQTAKRPSGGSKTQQPKKPITLWGAVIIAVAIIIASVLIVGVFSNEFRELLTGGNGLEVCEKEHNGICEKNHAPNYSVADLIDFDLEAIGLEIHFIDVNQGDAMLVKFGDEKTMLIDAGTQGVYASGTAHNYYHTAGGNTVPSATRNKYMNYLSSNLDGNHIDYLVVTHPDADHINMLWTVVDTYSIGTVYANDAPSVNSSTGSLYLNDKIKSEADKAGGNVGEAIWVGESGADFKDIFGAQSDYTVDIFGAGYGFSGHSSNNLSLMVTIEYAGRRVLLAGDAETQAENAFMAKYSRGKDIDLLKVSHHGASSASQQSFIDFFDSIGYAVITVGEQNGYAHPASPVMNRLFNAGAVTYRTNRHGNIVFFVGEDGSMGFKAEKPVPVENNSKGAPALMIA